MIAAGIDALLEEIEGALHEPLGGGSEAVARIEHTLTDGYAHALELEAERWRLERRISQIARNPSAGNAAGEIASLSERLSAADGDLARLRGLLTSLRGHADAVRGLSG